MRGVFLSGVAQVRDTMVPFEKLFYLPANQPLNRGAQPPTIGRAPSTRVNIIADTMKKIENEGFSRVLIDYTVGDEGGF
eukprot:SAG31_NODE_26175_length_447_cov_0.589080_1_plen_78_part_10